MPHRYAKGVMATMQAKDVTFGRAILADLDQLVRLRLGYLQDDFGELSPDQRTLIAAGLPAYFEHHLGRDIFAYVARDAKGTIVSCAWMLLVDKPPSPRFPHGRTGVLFNVYTVPERRRQGLARRVMERLIADARERQLDVIELHATSDGYPLYSLLGFEDDSNAHIAMRMML